MAAKMQVVEVNAPSEIDSAINAWILQGYALANRTPTSATMVKRKQFSVLWAVIGFVVCVIPLLIYLIVYAADSDRMVEIRLRNAAPMGTANRMAEERAQLLQLLEQGVISQSEYDLRLHQLSQM